MSNLVNLVTDSGKESGCDAGNTGDSGSTPGLGRSPGGGNGNRLQYSRLGNPRTQEPQGLQSMGVPRVWQDWAHSWHTSTHKRMLVSLHGICVPVASSYSSGQLPSPKKAGEMRSRLMAPSSLEPVNMLQDNEQLRSQEESRMLLSWR